ncbi:MAG: phosphatidylglycerophosphatase A, partial [Planctomycetota bacterium]
MNRPDPVQELVLTTGGLGHRRPASGTWGSLPPVVVSAILVAAGAGPASDLWWVHLLAMLAFLIAFSAVCITGADGAEARWGKDPSPVVADETAGMALTLLLMPPALFTNELVFVFATLAGAFLLFRAFDIAKLPPAWGMQKIAGGWGI